MARFIVWMEDGSRSVEVIEADGAIGAACNVVCEVWWTESETQVIWMCRVENIEDCVYNEVEVRIVFSVDDSQGEASGRLMP